LPHRCWVPPVRAPGQDFHLRSQRHARHTALRARRARSRRPNQYLAHHRIQVERSPWNPVRLIAVVVQPDR
jgi:hypothetical protein